MIAGLRGARCRARCWASGLTKVQFQRFCARKGPKRHNGVRCKQGGMWGNVPNALLTNRCTAKQPFVTIHARICHAIVAHFEAPDCVAS